jgi:hypothetical protein
MATVSNYVTLEDLPLELEKNGAVVQEVNFQMPAGAFVNNLIPMFFRIETLATAQSLRVKVLINGAEQFAYPTGLSGAQCFTVHEIINSNRFNAGANVIRFELTGTAGGLRISDIVLLYRMTV